MSTIFVKYSSFSHEDTLFAAEIQRAVLERIEKEKQSKQQGKSATTTSDNKRASKWDKK